MPAYSVRNEEFRDEIGKYAYPFDESSTLSNEFVSLGTDTILDAVFYLKTPHDLPIHIAVIDGTYGEANQALLLIEDQTGALVGTCLVSDSSTEELVLSEHGMRVGVLVFRSAGLQRVLGGVYGKVIPLLPFVAQFALDVCHVSSAPHVRYVLVGDTAVTGNVQIVARDGVSFRMDGATLRIDLAGELPDEATPIRSINGVVSRSIWLQGHPETNLRVATEPGKIRLSQAKDTR